MALTPISYSLSGSIAEWGLGLLFGGAGAVMLLLAIATGLSPAWRADDRAASTDMLPLPRSTQPATVLP